MMHVLVEPVRPDAGEEGLLRQHGRGGVGPVAAAARALPRRHRPGLQGRRRASRVQLQDHEAAGDGASHSGESLTFVGS